MNNNYWIRVSMYELMEPILVYLGFCHIDFWDEPKGSFRKIRIKFNYKDRKYIVYRRIPVECWDYHPESLNIDTVIYTMQFMSELLLHILKLVSTEKRKRHVKR